MALEQCADMGECSIDGCEHLSWLNLTQRRTHSQGCREEESGERGTGYQQFTGTGKSACTTALNHQSSILCHKLVLIYFFFSFLG
jgi:hypothetical protein